MTERRRLHALIEELPETTLGEAHRVLVGLRDRGFDEDLCLDEAAESERAWREHLAGHDPGERLDDASSNFLG